VACTARIRSLRPLAALAVGGLSLGLGSFYVLARDQEASEPVLPEITVVARHPPCHKFVKSQFISQFPACFPHQSLTLFSEKQA
jgi:hypothetical protein